MHTSSDLRLVLALHFLAAIAFCSATDAAEEPSSVPAPHSAHIDPEGDHASKAPAPAAPASSYDADRWLAPNADRILPASAAFANAHGALTTLNLAGATSTKGHPFFAAIGTNGRACVSCHQPADAMSLSLDTIEQQWQATQGRDPLFAPVDGADCPHLPQGERSSHSLLLTRGLIRVFRPWPPRAASGEPIDPQFTIDVVRDPTGCNTHPVYGLSSREPMISVYRRPRPATNVKYLTAVGFPFEPKNGLPLPLDRETGRPMSGNLMADGRNGTLKIQAIEAMRTHLQMNDRPRESILRAILDFESALYSAQSHDRWGGSLAAEGASGGPEALAQFAAGALQGGREPIWSEFKSWARTKAEAPKGSAPKEAEAQRAFRASVARGAESFATKTFLIWDAAGITSMGFGNPVRNTCAFCHNMQHTGMDVAPGQVDLGTTNEPFADPAPELPLFKLTCKDAHRPHPHLGRVVYTQDPGFALTTGKCADIGKITIQQMRGLAARAPYFANGSARTLRAVVDFYDRRYNIGYTEEEKQDLVNLMSVL